MFGLEEVVGLEVISSDARVIGTVEGAGIDLAAWRVLALRIGLRRGIEEMIGRKRKYFAVDKVYIKTSDLEAISDAIIMRKPISSINEVVQSEDEAITPAGAFMGMRVICCNARFVGNVDNLIIDPGRDWSIPYIQVKLEREAMEQLNLHRSFMASSVINVRTSDIKALGDMVMLTLTMDELKARVSSGARAAGEEGSAAEDGTTAVRQDDQARTRSNDQGAGYQHQ